MSVINEKVAYLRGLKDGMNLPQDNVSRLFDAIIDALAEAGIELDDHEQSINSLDECIDDLYDELDEITDDLDEVYEELDELDEYLSELEEYEDDDEYDDYFDDDEDDDEFEGFINFTCPHCDEHICMDLTLVGDGGKIDCPHCDGMLFDTEE